LQFFCSGDLERAKTTFLQVLHRFDCLEWKKNEQQAKRDNVIKMKNSTQALLIEEALSFIILMVTDLPHPPNDDVEARVLPSIRRELLHRLVVGPVTHSQLPECYSLVPDSNKIKADVIEKVVFEISDMRHSSPLEPPKLVLKNELWKEYDPSFPRMAQRAHHNAIEVRPKVTSPQPMCPPLCQTHESFRYLRAGFLINSELLRLIRHLLSMYTSQRTQNTDAYISYHVSRVQCVTQRNTKSTDGQ
jgi:hypothetical protein